MSRWERLDCMSVMLCLFCKDCRVIVSNVASRAPLIDWGLRDYGAEGQLGLEKTPEEYVEKMVAVFREVRRVLKADGTVFLNLGDSYARAPEKGEKFRGKSLAYAQHNVDELTGPTIPSGLKPKDLVGIPWRVAFALQADGWYLRSDIVWSKPNPMPESVRDRPTKSHEYVFLLSKSQTYYYDAAAVAEPCDLSQNGRVRIDLVGGASHVERGQHSKGGTYTKGKHSGQDRQSSGHRIVENVAKARAAGADHDSPFGDTRNARSVWTIPTKPYAEAHFATFPSELAERCIKAGSAPGDTVLDPFGGSGTTAAVATGHGRNAIHIDLRYHELAEKRIGPMFCDLVNHRNHCNTHSSGPSEVAEPAH